VTQASRDETVKDLTRVRALLQVVDFELAKMKKLQMAVTETADGLRIRLSETSAKLIDAQQSRRAVVATVAVFNRNVSNPGGQLNKMRDTRNEATQTA